MLSKKRILLAGALFLSVAGTGHASVFTNVAETVAEGYVVLFELDPPVDGGFRNDTPVPYSTNNHNLAPPFDRVAYYLELTTENETKWVYVSMEAFTETAAELGLPHNQDNPVVHQRNVRNMNVLSNVEGIQTGAFLDGGHVEMWPSNYGPSDSHGVWAASSQSYDWGDSGARTSSGYGSFQIHNPLARQTLLAYNRWGVLGGANDDIGIGNQPSGEPDWTFAGNTADFSERRLVILVRPRTFDLSFTTLPQNRQLYPRHLGTNSATVRIAGTESFGGYDAIMLRVFRNGILDTTINKSLVYQNGVADFSFTPTITAELANYGFELLLQQGNEYKMVERILDVVAGDAFIFYGQSNAEAKGYDDSGRSANEYASRWIRTFGQNGDSAAWARNSLNWVEAEGDGDGLDPGSIGQWAMVLGRQIVDTHQIPVAVLNGSRGGHNIGQLQKDRDDPDNLQDSPEMRRTYNRLRHRAIQSGLGERARALFYYQGESDKNDAFVHASGFARLYEDWGVDFPALEQVYVTQIRPGCVNVPPSSVALRDVQRRFADQYPNTSTMASNGLKGHDGCHFTFAGGYEDLGFNHYRQVARDLYGAPDHPDLDSLNADYVAFTDTSRTEIRLVLRNVGATVHFPPAALADFAIGNTAVTIVDWSVAGHTIYFQLSGPANEDSVLEYRGHLELGEWITNGLGLGLLTFVEPILSPSASEPQITLHSPVGSREADVGETLIIDASGSSIQDSAIVRFALYANGVLQAETPGDSLQTTWQPTAPGAYLLTIRGFAELGDFSDQSVSVFANPPPAPGGIGEGLRVWLKAEAGVVLGNWNQVAEWKDQSGQGHHMIQSDSSAQPEVVPYLYGMGPGLHFDGNDFLTSIHGMPTGDYTKIVQFTLNSDDPGFVHNMVSSAEAGNSSTGREHALYFPQLRPTLYHNVNFAQGNRPVTLHEPAVVVATYQSGNRQGRTYLDGELVGIGMAPGNNTKSSIQIGAYLSNHFMFGSIAEVMIYDRVLDEEERQGIAAYLVEKHETPFQKWQREVVSSGGTEAGATPLAYAFGWGSHELPTHPSQLLDVGQQGPQIEVTYQRPMDRPDVFVQLERSTDLLHWLPVPSQLAEAVGPLQLWRHGETIEPGTPAVFFRLRATLPTY